MNEISDRVRTESSISEPDRSKTSAGITPSNEPPPSRDGIFRRLASSAPTGLVLALLVALAWWGHHTGWTLPKFSELTSSGSLTKDDWCAEHSVPESICVECNESLLPRARSSWCRKHGVHNC